MPATYRLDRHESTLCIVVRDADWGDPQMRELWYPIGPCSPSDWADLIGAEAFPEARASAGVYLVYIPGFRYHPPTRFGLADGGQTRPIHGTTEPIPCPKVRKGVPTRYLHGKWEKCLKSTGWTAA